MKNYFMKFRYLLLVIIFFNILKIYAEDFSLTNRLNEKNQLFIESNNQSSDLKNSIFYANGNVIITNTNNDFTAKSNKAIFYKSIGKIKLIGNVEVVLSESNQVKAGEILYYLNENKFEAISDPNQRVNTKFTFN